ncbi:GNAT family N-acetyltransferase [Actinocorallia longicatena]|uniref:GNAT family N-acetyltransferase n=1 Tax=Actinocorallia longicatena TaxID=111803 RepID=A0ABP6QE64_9ACTN
MDNATTVGSKTRTDALGLLPALTDLYTEVYAEPPYNSAPKFSRARFLARTRDQINSPGFALAAAERDPAELLGFAFGFTLPAGTWWANTGAPPAPLLDEPVFAVVELVVAASARAQGLGRRLLDELLAGRPERYATLAAVLDGPAYAMYLRWGWQKVGEFRTEPPYSDALALRISSDASPLAP